nr:acyltransferase [Corynebacterium riegelii]
MLPQLDGLRGLAALGILTTHVAFQTGLTSTFVERFDYFVAVFFALSAFLLSRGQWVAKGYYYRRLVRLAPAYLTCVAVVLVALPPLTHVSLQQVLANVFLLQVYVPDGLIEGLTQLWSLCVEVAFYLVLPAYMALGDRGRQLALLIAVPFGLAWPWLVDQQTWPPSYAPWFAVGLILAELERLGVRWRGPRWPWLLAAAAIAYLAGLAGPAGLTHPTPAEFNVRVILGTFFAAFVVGPYALTGAEKGANSVLASRPMRTLGRWSYSLFLWHVAVLYFAFPTLGVPWFSGHFVPVWVFTTVASLVVSYASYELVERPAAAAMAKHPAKVSKRLSPA